MEVKLERLSLDSKRIEAMEVKLERLTSDSQRINAMEVKLERLSSDSQRIEAMEVKLERLSLDSQRIEAMEVKLERLSSDSQRNERTVLFVEVFSELRQNLLGKPFLGTGPDGNPENRKAWQGLKIDRCSTISECVRKISSGRYKAIVLVDLDYNDMFYKDLGGLLQDFVRAGGVIAFFPVIKDGFATAQTLNTLFNTEWEPRLSSGGSSWEVCNENYNTVTELFGDLSQLERLPGNVVSVKNVPQHEQCFTEDRHYRHYGYLDNSEKEDMYAKEVCIAVHRYGHGSIAYFGDVSCTPGTEMLVAAYIRSRVVFPKPHQTSSLGNFSKVGRITGFRPPCWTLNRTGTATLDVI